MKFAVFLLTLSLCIRHSIAAPPQTSDSKPSRTYIFKFWTASEDAKIVELVKASNGRPSWTKIATVIQRRPSQIRDHYFARLDTSIELDIIGKWTKNDDERIAAFAEEAYRNNEKPKWAVLGSAMRRPRRTVATRYTKHIKGLARSSSSNSMSSLNSAEDMSEIILSDDDMLIDKDDDLFAFSDLPHFDEWTAHDEAPEASLSGTNEAFDLAYHSNLEDRAVLSEYDFDEISSLLQDEAS